MEIAGCTGKKKQARKQGEEETGAEEEVFFLKYIKFYFLNEGYFGYFLELLGAPSNTLNKGVGTDNNGLEVRIVQID